MVAEDGGAHQVFGALDAGAQAVLVAIPSLNSSNNGIGYLGQPIRRLHEVMQGCGSFLNSMDPNIDPKILYSIIMDPPPKKYP